MSCRRIRTGGLKWHGEGCHRRRRRRQEEKQDAAAGLVVPPLNSMPPPLRRRAEERQARQREAGSRSWSGHSVLHRQRAPASWRRPCLAADRPRVLRRAWPRRAAPRRAEMGTNLPLPLSLTLVLPAVHGLHSPAKKEEHDLAIRRPSDRTFSDSNSQAHARPYSSTFCHGTAAKPGTSQ